MEEEPSTEKTSWDLHFAAFRGDLLKLRALLDQGHDPNVFDELSWTPLHYAVRHGHLEMARCLLKAGADVNAHDEARIGETPLGEVAANCSMEMARTLVDAGADPTIRGWMTLCALDRARERKRAEGRQVYELLCRAARKFRHA